MPFETFKTNSFITENKNLIIVKKKRDKHILFDFVKYYKS